MKKIISMSILVFFTTFFVGIFVCVYGCTLLEPLSLYESMSVMAALYTASIIAVCAYLILRKKK